MKFYLNLSLIEQIGEFGKIVCWLYLLPAIKINKYNCLISEVSTVNLSLCANVLIYRIMNTHYLLGKAKMKIDCIYLQPSGGEINARKHSQNVRYEFHLNNIS